MADVTEIQDQAEAYADALIDDMNADLQILSLRSLDVAGIIPRIPDVDLSLIDITGGLSQTSTNISLPDLESFEGVTRPTSPELESVTTPNAPSVPTFDESAPSLVLPDAPDSSLPAAPSGQPEFAPPAIPVKPSATLPTVPTFAPIAIPEIDGIEIPLFEATAPVDDLVEPSTSFAFVELDYDSEIMIALKAKLKGDLVNGGYGIETADELGIWERETERSLKAADAAIEEATTQRAARGFILPDGALWAAQQIAEQDSLDKRVTASREIAIQRAEKFFQARQVTIQRAIELENILIQYSGAKAERALNAAKAVIEVGISLYQLRVEKLRALQDGYRTQAQVYETRIRANLASLEAQKAKIEASNLLLSSQQVQVQIYEAQVSGVSKLIDLYRVEMEAAKIQAEIEGLKLQGYRTAVEAYSEQVRAREAEFRMFEAQIRGETAKVDVYRASAEAYNSVVNGIKVKAEAEDIVARAQIDENKLLLDKHRADIDSYRAAIEKASLNNRAILERLGLGVEIEKVLDAKEATRKQVVAQISKANVDSLAHNAELKIKAADIALQGFIKLQDLSQSGLTEAVRARASVVSSALNQLTGVAVQSS